MVSLIFIFGGSLFYFMPLLQPSSLLHLPASLACLGEGPFTIILWLCVCVLMCLCVYKFFFPIYGFGFRDFVAAFSLGTFDNTAGVLTFRDVSSSGPGQAWGHCVWGTWLIFTSLLFPVVSFFLWWPLASLLKECLQRKHQRAPELQGGEERRS